MTLSDSLTVAILGGAVSLLVSLATIWLQTSKWNTGEKQKTNIDAAASLTDASMAIVNELRKDVTSLRLEVDALRDENQQLREQLKELEAVRDWAERLVYQVRSLGHEPVTLK